MDARTADLTLLVLAFLVICEFLSWETSTWPGTCIVSPEQHERADQYDYQQPCATFFDGSLMLLGRADKFIEDHDKSIVAVFTMVLAVSTIGLWLATVRLWEAGERQIGVALKAADAAEKSATASEDALFVGQRPYIFVDLPRFKETIGPDSIDPMAKETWPFIIFPVENHGQTPAVLFEACFESLCAPSLPDAPIYRKDTIYTELRYVFGKDVSDHLIFPFKTPIDGQVVNDCLVGTAIPSVNGRNLWAFGYIKYKDVFGYIHTVGFCWRYQMDVMRFLPDDHQAYNYRRSEPPEGGPPINSG